MDLVIFTILGVVAVDVGLGQGRVRQRSRPDSR